MPGSQAWNRQLNVIVPHSPEIQPFGWQCSKGSMDDEHWDGYLFCETAVTESAGVKLKPSSLGVELKPLPLLVPGPWGKEPN
jgi:hypothetical protein